jgi:hypothetical protein
MLLALKDAKSPMRVAGSLLATLRANVILNSDAEQPGWRKQPEHIVLMGPAFQTRQKSPPGLGALLCQASGLKSPATALLTLLVARNRNAGRCP